jgi:hypothetical protein
MTTQITPEQAAHVLWHIGQGGYPAGSFTTRLLEAWSYADPGNSARLAKAFPGYGEAVNLIRIPARGVDGAEILRCIASGGYRLGQLAEQRHQFRDLDADSEVKA